MRDTQQETKTAARAKAANTRHALWVGIGVLGLIVSLACATLARADGHEKIIS